MRKKYCTILIWITLILSICGCGLSFQAEIPEEGVWYCEELKMTIDFSMREKSEPDCVKQYADDGSYTILRCYVDYGSGMYICSQDEETDYYRGNFKYKDDVFIYTTFEGDTYYFVEIEDTIEDSDNI